MSFVLWKLGLKPVENPKGLAHYGIERHVPDYDLVGLREIAKGYAYEVAHDYRIMNREEIVRDVLRTCQ